MSLTTPSVPSPTSVHSSIAISRRPGKKRKRESQETVRVFSWNCDGIVGYFPFDVPPTESNLITTYFRKISPPPLKRPDVKRPRPEPLTIRKILQNSSWPEFLCLQEVKILSTDKGLLKCAEVAANTRLDHEDDGPEYHCHSSLAVPSLKFSSQKRRMYGVITYVRSDINQHITSSYAVPWDDEGRVLIMEFRTGWALLNIYALNGTDSPYVPRSTGTSTGQTRHERKREFSNLLMEECKGILAKPHINNICLVGDFNISRSSLDSHPRLRPHPPHVQARFEFNTQFIPQLDLIDAWRELHGDRRGYTWFRRGVPEGEDAARVDLTLLTLNLWDGVEGADIVERSIPGSDHKMIWVAFKVPQEVAD